MRTLVFGLLWLCGLSLAGPAFGQTWTQPLTFDSSPYVSQEDTCEYPSQTLYVADTGNSIYAPVVVYRVINSPRLPSRLIRPWHVQVQPQYSYLDFSVWVCDNHSGYTLSGCYDVSDNGPGMVDYVTVPGFYAVNHYVVVAGDIDNWPQYCGPYTLTATKS